MGRRAFIRLSLLPVGAVGLAGCAGEESANNDGSSVGEDITETETAETATENEESEDSPAGGFPTYDLPMYSNWPPETPRTNDFVLFGHANMQILHEADSEEVEED